MAIEFINILWWVTFYEIYEGEIMKVKLLWALTAFAVIVIIICMSIIRMIINMVFDSCANYRTSYYIHEYWTTREHWYNEVDRVQILFIWRYKTRKKHIWIVESIFANIVSTSGRRPFLCRFSGWTWIFEFLRSNRDNYRRWIEIYREWLPPK